MSVSNELITEIAFALVAAKDRRPNELSDLKEILLDVHSTLKQLSERSRSEKAVVKAAGASQQKGN